jgi:hypothetical protein
MSTENDRKREKGLMTEMASLDKGDVFLNKNPRKYTFCRIEVF